MDSRTLLRTVVVVVAVLLQLVARPGLGVGAEREPLPEDAPALLRNRALEPRDEPLLQTAARAAADPAAAWDPAGEVVGRSRYRPVATALFAVERGLGRDGTLVLAALVSLLLHVGVVLGAVGLLSDLGASRGALWLGGLLVAASPAALVAAAWPARQAHVLAALLGVVGIRLVLRPAVAARLAGGLLLGVACLAHEAAAGLGLAAVVLAVSRRGRAGARPWATEIALAVPVVLALAVRSLALSPLPAAPEGDVGPGLLDAAAGVVATLAAALLPARVHPIGDLWAAAPWARIACPLLLVASAALLARRARRPAAALWLAALAAAAPVLATAWVGGTPFHHGYTYLVLPVLAAAVAVTVASAASRGGALRPAAAAAGALLVGAAVAGSLTAAPAFRGRAAFVDLAARAAPGSDLVAAWRVGDAARGGADAEGGAAAPLLAALPRAKELAARLVDDAGQPTGRARSLRRDAAASVGVAAALAGYARTVAALPDAALPPGAAARLADLSDVAAAAATVAPRWGGGWVVLAQVASRIGAGDTALEAAERAVAIAPEDVARLELATRLALAVGNTDVAIEHIAQAAVLEAKAAEREGRLPRREHVMLHAETLAADASSTGLLVEFSWALRMLLPLYEGGDRGDDLRSLLYDIHLYWGDGLASLGRTATARIAYQRAVQLGGDGSEAGEHLRWLEDRLRDELREAHETLERAASGQGNVANALLDLAIVYCRSGDWATADEIFAKIEEGQNGMNAALRFTRAVHRFASRGDQLEIAEKELRQVLAEDATLTEARYRLGSVLLELERVEEAAEAYRRAARDGAAHEWAVESLEAARRLEGVLARPAR